MAKLIIEIEIEDKIEAYRAVNILANEYKVTFASWGDENWVFDDPSKCKYFMNREYTDLETGKAVKIQPEENLTINPIKI
jgi:hypothetical protein